jgi:hypothetical protein
MGFQEVSNVFAYHAQLSFPHSSASERAPTLSPKLLDAFAAFRKATIGFVMSVSLQAPDG